MSELDDNPVYNVLSATPPNGMFAVIKYRMAADKTPADTFLALERLALLYLTQALAVVPPNLRADFAAMWQKKLVDSVVFNLGLVQQMADADKDGARH